MKKISEVMTNMTIQTSDFDCNICEKCGTKTQTIIEVLGRKRKVPMMCKCKEEEYNKQREIDKQQEQIYKLEKLKKHSLMDDNFKDCKFKTFEIDKNNEKWYKLGVTYCEQWERMKKENVGMLFWGPPGTGKTYLSFCIANELINRLIPVIAISSIGLLNRIKETYNSYGKEGEVEIINSLKNAALLIIDDLGAENSTAWAKEKLYEIIDSRYRDGKPMIVTTNLSRQQLKDKLTGEDGITRTYDRLVEMCTPVEVEGDSKRAKYAVDKTKILKELMR